MEVTCRLVLCVLCALSDAPAVRGQRTHRSQMTTQISPLSEVGSAVTFSPSTPLLKASTSPGATSSLRQNSADLLQNTSLDSTSSYTSLPLPLQDTNSNKSSRSSKALTNNPHASQQPAQLNDTTTPREEATATPAVTDPKRSFPLDINATDKDSRYSTSDNLRTPTSLPHKMTGSTGSSLTSTCPNTPSTTAAPPLVHSTATSQIIFMSSPVGAHEEGPSLLNVGDDVPLLLHSRAPLDPLLAALLSVFIVIGAIISLFLFLKFRQHSEQPEFHRLQDLPMDDMMEDTPLSRYSY
ncbi:mucin-1-like isoform X1 [Arapaima gigas]